MYKQDLALNNQQWLICHKPKPQPNPTPKISVLSMTLNRIWCWEYSSGYLWNVELYFIAITPKSTLIQSYSASLGSIYISNRFV